MKKLSLFCSSSLLLFTLSSCVVSSNPLSPLSESIADDRLIGSWYACDIDKEEKGKCGFLHVGKAENARHLRAILVRNEDGTFKTTTFNLNITEVNEKFYISVPLSEVEKDKEIEEEAYFILFYEFQGTDRFLIYFMDGTEEVALSVEKGKLKGNVKKFGDEITDSTEKLRDFLSTADHKEIFEPGLVFIRIPPVNKRPKDLRTYKLQ